VVVTPSRPMSTAPSMLALLVLGGLCTAQRGTRRVLVRYRVDPFDADADAVAPVAVTATRTSPRPTPPRPPRCTPGHRGYRGALDRDKDASPASRCLVGVPWRRRWISGVGARSRSWSILIIGELGSAERRACPPRANPARARTSRSALTATGPFPRHRRGWEHRTASGRRGAPRCEAFVDGSRQPVSAASSRSARGSGSPPPGRPMAAHVPVAGPLQPSDRHSIGTLQGLCFCCRIRHKTRVCVTAVAGMSSSGRLGRGSGGCRGGCGAESEYQG
jgi:hypothetical protein